MSEGSPPTPAPDGRRDPSPPLPNLGNKQNWAKKILSWVFSLAGLTVFIVAVRVIPQYNDMIVTVYPIELPESIKPTAGSPAVFTDEVISNAQDTLNIQGGFTPQTIRIERDCFDANMFIQDLRRALTEGFSYEVKIVKPRDKDSYEHTADHLAEYAEGILPFFRRRSVEVRGELTDKGNQASLVLTATFPEGRVYESSTKMRAESRDILVKQAGTELLRFAAPWLYASTAAFGDRSDGRQTLEILSREFPLSDRSLVLAMKGYTYLYSNMASPEDANVEFADKSFKEALTINPNSYWALIGRARVSIRLFTKGGAGPKTGTQWSHWNEAEETLKNAIREDPGNTEAYAVMYVLYLVKGDQPRATEQQKLLIKHAKKRQQYIRAVGGIISLNVERPDGLKEAIKDLEILSEEPGITDSLERSSFLLSRGIVAAKSSDLEALENVAVEAYQNRDGCLLVDLARLALKNSEEEKEVVVRQTWLKRSDTYNEYAEKFGVKGFHFYNTWGKVNEELGAYERAIQKYRKALEFYGDEFWALANWGNTLFRQGKYREADVKYLEAIAAGKTPASAQPLITSRLNQSLLLTDPAIRGEALTAFQAMFTKLELEWPQLTPVSYGAASYANCILGNEGRAIAYREKMKIPGYDVEMSYSNLMPYFNQVDDCIRSLTARTIPNTSNRYDGQIH